MTKGDERLTSVRVENRVQLFQRGRLKVESHSVLQSTPLAMNDVLRVENAGEKTIDVLFEVFELGRQRKIEFLVQKEKIHEEIVAHQRLLLADDQVENLTRATGNLVLR